MKSIDLSLIKKFFIRKHKAVGVRNPNKDWLMIFGTFIIFFVLSVILGGYMFWGISSGTLFLPSSEAEAEPVLLDKQALTTISAIYQTKEDKLNALASSSPAVVDPSL
ncbi:MAG: hypothetical protein K0S38_765 [Candidatus Paceibacter sp.]|jgi:hypothetical protein|nr:hypothetical protein [Candidatus Paceibacter sp.]